MKIQAIPDLSRYSDALMSLGYSE
jgi:C1A family cysteine protease